MKRRSACLAFVCGLALAGCATPPGSRDDPPHNWSGRLAVQVHSTPPQSLTAGFELNGSSEVGELRLHSPLGTTLAITLIGNLLGDGEFAAMALLPAMLMLAAMFFCSTYYSFKDCFTSDTLYA